MTVFGDRQRIENEISSVFSQAESVGEELQASLARYACVLANSYLEASCREILAAYSEVRADPSVSRYVQRRLNLFGVSNVERILQLVGDFDPDVRKRFEEVLDDRLRDGINSIHAHRNNIAHGRRTSISVGRIRQYYSVTQEVVAKLRRLFPSQKTGASVE